MSRRSAWQGQRTQSVQKRIPTRSIGTIERLDRLTLKLGLRDADFWLSNARTKRDTLLERIGIDA